MEALVVPIAEAAARLRVSRKTAYRLADSGALRSLKIGKKLFVKQGELARFLRAQLTAASKRRTARREKRA